MLAADGYTPERTIDQDIRSGLNASRQTQGRRCMIDMHIASTQLAKQGFVIQRTTTATMPGGADLVVGIGLLSCTQKTVIQLAIHKNAADWIGFN